METPSIGARARGRGPASGTDSAPPATAAPIVAFVEADTQEFAVVGFAVERSDRRPRFVSFHFHETEAATTAGEYIGCQLNRAHGSEFGSFRRLPQISLGRLLMNIFS